jgi:carbamoyl-phosphate synthase small subunit
MNKMKLGFIVLEDGTVYQGESFGFSGEKTGEIVFNTGMSGYQEVLTDPSYKGQIVVMTYPLIGNYGINTRDQESGGPQVSGFIVKENSELPSNWRSENSLSSYLIQHRIIGVEGVDTRAITRHIRLQGAMKAIISTETDNVSSLLAKVKAAPGLVGRDLVKEVTCRKAYIYRDESAEEKELLWLEYLPDCSHSHQNTDKEAGQNELQIPKKYSVVAMDFGIKQNILRQLEAVGCEVNVVPAHYSAEEIFSLKPHGVFLSNGPGDPAAVTYAVETVKKLIKYWD